MFPYARALEGSNGAAALVPNGPLCLQVQYLNKALAHFGTAEVSAAP
jgi:hypothetical protein